MNERRILVTGGNGYVGRHLVRRLAGKAQLCVVDNLRGNGCWRIDPAQRDRVQLERLDIRNATAIRALMDEFRPNTVIHLAAIHYIPECEADPVTAVDTNITGTVALLRTCPEGCGFVYASSGAVYKPDHQPHEEDRSALEPDDVYGLSKLHGEQFVQRFVARRGLRSVIVRLFNVVGPGETNPHLLPEIVAQLKAGREVIELGNLSPQRDYIDVRDVADGFATVALENHAEPGIAQVVNLGTGRAHAVSDVIGKLHAASGVRFEVRQDPARLRNSDRPVLAADMRKMLRLFGWRPRRTLDEAIRDLWAEPDLAPGLTAKYQ